MQIEDKLYKVYVDSGYDIKELNRYIKKRTDFTSYHELEGEVSGEKANILVDRWLREGKQVFKNQTSNEVDKNLKKAELIKSCIFKDYGVGNKDEVQEEFKKALEDTVKIAEDSPEFIIKTALEKGWIIQDSFKEEGRKDNSTKLPMSILFKQFPRALQAVILASSYGHNKYKEVDSDYLNFSRVKEGSKVYFDADIRHQLDKEIYGENDNESGLPHIFHEAFDKLAKCELWIKENDIDIKEFSKNYLEKLQDKK